VPRLDLDPTAVIQGTLAAGVVTAVGVGATGLGEERDRRQVPVRRMRRVRALEVLGCLNMAALNGPHPGLLKEGMERDACDKQRRT